ncbi:MAG: hypothetical protein EZS28_006338 [Streblomastix strix]|uniref:Uncharacterized protein n=1 Tax=Streblomastix strix TaxID=222440 RepID=A0A5J4WSL3_9EUKA|nr:MAG: hypothetical protein EZS28_006338 [Streblomastix strix]
MKKITEILPTGDKKITIKYLRDKNIVNAYRKWYKNTQSRKAQRGVALSKEENDILIDIKQRKEVDQEIKKQILREIVKRKAELLLIVENEMRGENDNEDEDSDDELGGLESIMLKDIEVKEKKKEQDKNQLNEKASFDERINQLKMNQHHQINLKPKFREVI